MKGWIMDLAWSVDITIEEHQGKLYPTFELVEKHWSFLLPQSWRNEGMIRWLDTIDRLARDIQWRLDALGN